MRFARTHCSASAKLCSLARIEMWLACAAALRQQGVIHALVCGALWHTVVARHNMMVDAWRGTFSGAGISSSQAPHVKQLPQRLRAASLRELPSEPSGSHPRDSKTTWAALTVGVATCLGRLDTVVKYLDSNTHHL